MKKIIDDKLSEGFYQMYHSRDFYKGTSFKISEWKLNAHYYSDEYIIDFVSLDGCLLFCKRSHVSNEETKPIPIIENDVIIGIEKNPCWGFIMGNNGRGVQGDAATISVGEVTTGEPGSEVEVINVGDSSNAILNFKIPRGDKGDKGDKGDTPILDAQVSRVTSEEGAPASATVNLTESTFNFSFNLPKGDTGAPGSDGENGKDGTPGADGAWYEYIYKLAKSEDEIAEIVAPESVDQDDYVPSGWTDNPTGISLEYPYEVTCMRKKSAGTPEDPRGHWGIFIGPSIWSKWGVNGQDGDGVEYIFIRTTTYTKPTTPVAPGIENEELPTDPDWGTWTDDPTGVDSTYRWEWVSQRKFVSNKWGPFSVPALWAYYSKDGTDGTDGVVPDYYTYVYCKSETKPEKPSFNTPVPPEDSNWKDYPDDTGQWWQCIGIVDGKTNLVVKWGEVIPLNGRDGTAQDGKFYETRFTKNTDNINPPKINNGNRDPSVPEAQPPVYWVTINNEETEFPVPGPGEYLWQTWAQINPNNTLNSPWSTPVCISGENGAPGDWTSFVFKMSNADVPPDKPTSRNPIPLSEGWQDAPGEGDDKWWVTSALIDGTTQKVKEGYDWASPKPIVGEDGAPGADGTWTDFKFACVNRGEEAQSINKSDVNPGSDWYDTWEQFGSDKDIWMTWAQKKRVEGQEYLVDPETGWATARRINGEQGIQGPVGENGESGIPGVTFEVRFALGTKDGPNEDAAGADRSQGVREPEHWTLYQQAITEEQPVLWFIQNRIIYTSNEEVQSDDRGSLGTCIGPWSAPAPFSGVPGDKGATGPGGQIIYPEGLYASNKTYRTTENTAPYVLVYNTGSSKADGKYWLLKVAAYDFIGDNHDPDGTGEYPTEDWLTYWQEFNDYQAIYSDVGIIGNALVGSAVFNKQFMFSQQGANAEGEPDNNYQNFDPAQPFGGQWTPNILFDFEKGKCYLAQGKFIVDENGNLTLNDVSAENLNVTGDSTLTDAKAVNLTVSGNSTLTDATAVNLNVSGDSTLTDATAINLTVTGDSTLTDVTINGKGFLGKAVFNGDWLYSQDGIDQEGNPAYNYEEFNTETPYEGTFIPNILFNFKNGNGHLGAGKIKFEDGKVTTESITIGSSSNFKYEYTKPYGSASFRTSTLHSVISHSDTSITYIDFDPSVGNWEVNGIYEGIVLNITNTLATVHIGDPDGSNPVNIKGYIAGCAAYDSKNKGKQYWVEGVLLSPGSALKYLFKVDKITTNHVEGQLYITNASEFVIMEGSRLTSDSGYPDRYYITTRGVQDTYPMGIRDVIRIGVGSGKVSIFQSEARSSYFDLGDVQKIGHTATKGHIFKINKNKSFENGEYLQVLPIQYKTRDVNLQLIFSVNDPTSNSIELFVDGIKSANIGTANSNMQMVSLDTVNYYEFRLILYSIGPNTN